MANILAGSDGAANEEMTAKRLNVVDWISMIVLIVGGLNWALVGLFDIDIVARILGAMSTASRGLYVLVGLATLYSIYLCVRMLPAKSWGKHMPVGASPRREREFKQLQKSSGRKCAIRDKKRKGVLQALQA